MHQHHDDPNSVDPKTPHAYVERMNLPYSVPKPFGPGMGGGPEIPFAKTAAPDDCELCRKRRSDPIHTASDEAAASAHWPL
jgi:hypothetical protein